MASISVGIITSLGEKRVSTKLNVKKLLLYSDKYGLSVKVRTAHHQ